MKRILLTITLSAPSILVGLPVEIITQKGNYLKGLITSVQLGQFKKDANIFFDFDAEFPPTQEAINTYKQIADELLAHAKVTRGEKFEERKLLLGTTIHNTRALLKSFGTGITCTVGIVGTTLLGMGTLSSYGRPHPIGILATIASGLVTIGFGIVTKRYWTRATNHAEIITQEMKMLNEIIDLCTTIQKKMQEKTIVPTI